MPPERSLIRRLVPPLLGKAMVIGFLILMLLIPLANMEDLVRERVGLRQEAAQRVAESWGGAQITAAVLLSIPVETSRVVIEHTSPGRETQRTEVSRSVVYVLPDLLTVHATADPDTRRVGLYATPVYTARVRIQGEFVNQDFAPLLLDKPDRQVKWSEARLLVLNSESRALRAVDELRVAGESARVAADSYAGLDGISAPVPESALRPGDGGSRTIPFQLQLTLTGSTSLKFLPLARKADISLESSWPHPKFEGAPAPLDPQIGDQGFSARWSVLEINRSFGQVWTDAQVTAGIDAAAAFAQNGVGVTFYEPVDVYQRSYRAVRYAALLIGITFLTFFLWEHVSGIAIHAMQYLMVGMALALFYLLLLALSEHAAFDLAYGVSAAALVGLITVYLTGVLRRFSLAMGAGAGLATLYTLLYWILRSEDYSLLMGALLLFGVLAVLMLATRNIDWTRIGKPGREAVAE
jgi:inner membrane protein